MPDDEDEVTSPDLQRVACPACKGQKRRLNLLKSTGTLRRRVWGPCVWCRGEGKVDRQRHSEWHLGGHGEDE